MPFFAEETLEAVRSIPLYEIVRTQVDLTRSGKNWRGLSPFTNEKTPSFFVLTDRNYYKCHSSGMAGDGIRFVQETERLNFQEAVEVLAETGAIQKLELTGSIKRFDGDPAPHYHIRCIDCGRVDNAPLAPLNRIEDRLYGATVYTITGHRLEFTGLCPDCTKKEAERGR